MALNASEGFNPALELFSGLYEDMSPTDLPQGLSPDNQDVVYLPGNVGTRPALNRSLPTSGANQVPEPTTDVVSLTEFAMPSGDYLTLWLYSSGNLWQQDKQTGTVAQIGSVARGSQFHSITAFNKQWFAFSSPALAAHFSDSPFCGTDVPAYYDGQNLWRVTQDAPGANPVFANLPTAPISLAATASGGSLSVSAVVSSGNIIHDNGTYHTKLVYTCTTAVPSTWLGEHVTVTGCTGTFSSWANVSDQTVIAVAGDTFTIYRPTGLIFVNLSGQSATATVAANVLTRSANIVTAYTGANVPSAFNIIPGLYVNVAYATGAAINGANWTISAITRDNAGLVTVTISTQLANLASGSVLWIGATDTTDFPVGYQTVYQVISETGGATTFTISNPTWGNGAVATSSGGSVFETWSGIFQVLSVGVDAYGNNFFTYFLLGADGSRDGSGGAMQAQIQAQVPPGPRSAVMMFKSINGAITAPSVPIQLSISGGPNLLSAQTIPLGPAGTAQRIIAFTPAYGSSYFYITPAVIPSTAGISPVLSLGTIIDDNTTTAVILDFSDAQLTAGTQIDIQGNNLFQQIVLAPCLGVIEYEGRLGWWGEINNLKNFVNMGFDGGYNPATLIIGPNTSGTGAQSAFSPGYTSWTNPGDVTGSSGYAAATLPAPSSGPQQSQFLNATNFGFSVPAAMQITGVQITASVENTINSGFDFAELGLIVPSFGDTLTNKIPYSASPTGMTFGGPNSLFGVPSLTGAQVNQSSFGTIFYALVQSSPGSTTVEVNNVQMTLYGNSGLAGAQPLGWNTTAAYNGITPDGNGTLMVSPNGFGFAYQMTSGAGFLNNCMISQGAYQDCYGAPIVEPSRSYYMRFQGTLVSGTASGHVLFALYSPSTGFISTASFLASSFSNSTGWLTAKFSQAMPVTIPSDLVLYITLDGNATTNFSIALDELGVIDVQEPVLFGQMRWSYFENEFGYDRQTGVLALDGPAKITAAFKQRGYLFALTDGPLHQTQNNGQSEPNGWGFPSFADECDCFGPNAVSSTEDIAWWAGFYGFRVFSGAAPKKLSQEIQRTWESINGAYCTLAWVTNDPAKRMVDIGIPTGSATTVSLVLPMSYRSVDSAYNVPDPIHVSYSGRMIATDLCRKWTRWNMPMSCGALLTETGAGKQMFFGGQGYGNFYSLNPAKYTDDDYGQISSYYTTYFWLNHDIEQNAPGVGLHRKLDTYLSAYVTGVGQIQPTPLVNNLNNPWAPLATVWDAVNQMWTTGSATAMPAYPLSSQQNYDLEWPLNVKGDRVAYKWAAVPLAGQTDAAFLLQHMVVTNKEDMVAPVRGSVVG